MSLSKPCRSEPSEEDTSDEDMNRLFLKVKRKRVRRRLLSSYYGASGSPLTPTPSSRIENVTEGVIVSVYRMLFFTAFINAHPVLIFKQSNSTIIYV